MNKEKCYVVTESRLLDLLIAEMICEMNERDGVDNWDWYGSSYDDIVKEYYPDDNPPDNMAMYDCAQARLEAGEFQEELNLGEFVLAYDLANGEDVISDYCDNPGYYDDY